MTKKISRKTTPNVKISGIELKRTRYMYYLTTETKGKRKVNKNARRKFFFSFDL